MLFAYIFHSIANSRFSILIHQNQYLTAELYMNSFMGNWIYETKNQCYSIQQY